MEYAAVDGNMIIIMMLALLITPTQVMLEMVYTKIGNEMLTLYNNGIRSMNVVDRCMIAKGKDCVNRIVI